MMEEEEDEDVILHSCRMLTLDMDFREFSVEITQDNRSNTIIFTYRQTDDQVRVSVGAQGID